MSLRKQEWLRRLASSGNLYQTISSKEYLTKKAKSLGIEEYTATNLSRLLLDYAYRPLGGNDLDKIVLAVVLEILEALIPEDSGLQLKAELLSGKKVISVSEIDLLANKKELFKLFNTKVKEKPFIDLTWKAAKVEEKQVLLALSPLLKGKDQLIRKGQVLQFGFETNLSYPVVFAGYVIREDQSVPVLPEKECIESFKRNIKSLTTRSMSGYSVKYVAIAVRKECLKWRAEYGFCTNRKLGRYLDSYIRERIYLFLLKKYDKAGKKEVYQRFMLDYPTLDGVLIPSVRPVGEPCAGKLACTVRGAD